MGLWLAGKGPWLTGSWAHALGGKDAWPMGPQALSSLYEGPWSLYMWVPWLYYMRAVVSHNCWVRVNVSNASLWANRCPHSQPRW